LIGERSGREFELLLVALRMGPARPALAAERLGITSDRLRPQISRALRDPERRTLVRRDTQGRYLLSASGARRADAIALVLRHVFAAVGRA
jgi:hypothetical protein